jgi:hypothetical protein
MLISVSMFNLYKISEQPLTINVYEMIACVIVSAPVSVTRYVQCFVQHFSRVIFKGLKV